VDVKHVKVWDTSVPGILDLKLHLRFLYRAIAYHTRSTDSRSTPQPVRWAIRELALFDSLAGPVSEDTLVWHLALRVISGSGQAKCREQ
jgi:hypothetical protein